MNGIDWNLSQNSKTLSVTIVSYLMFWCAAFFGVLTIFTHIAQIFQLRFEQYAYISFLFFLVIPAAILWQTKEHRSEIKTKDWLVLLFVLGLALLGAFISLSMRRIGRFTPDEYYYGTNPAYYVQHPATRMDFKLLFFYSGGQPFYSVGYLTATAFDYIISIFAYITKIQYIKVYYELGGGLGGLLIPLSIYLLLSQFSRTTMSAALGTFFTVLSIFLLAETVWTPGGYSFLRTFEGKIIMLFAGIPLFVYYSLRHFSADEITQYAVPIKRRIFHSTTINLFVLVAALTGMSTSAFMIFPILAAIIFVSYWLTFRETFFSFRDVIERGIIYLSTFFYLFYFAVFVAQQDKVDTAVAINVSNGYTDSVREYLVGFYNPSIPLTPVLLIIFSIAILFITKGKLRTFLAVWMGIVLLTVPNPIVAKLLLNLFRGIYFRLMYIYPFPLVIGIFSAVLYEMTGQTTRRKIIWAVASCAFCSILFFSPSSLFVSDRYTWGNWSTYKENVAAFEVVSTVPHGLMVAPYPISGAVRMIDTDFDQLVTRDDHLDVYLNLQGRGDEAKLRMDASDFLDGKVQEYDSFVRLMEMYPEVQSVVFYRKFFYRPEYAETAKQLTSLMQTLGFTNRMDLEDTVVFWK